MTNVAPASAMAERLAVAVPGSPAAVAVNEAAFDPGVVGLADTTTVQDALGASVWPEHASEGIANWFASVPVTARVTAPLVAVPLLVTENGNGAELDPTTG